MIFLLFSTFVMAQTPTATNSPFFNDLENFKNKSLSLRTEQQNLEASSDLLLSRKLFWTPKLNISANKNKTQVNSVSTLENNYLIQGDYLEADLSWNLFRGGADYHLLKDAQAEEKAQNLQVLTEALRVEINAADLIFKSVYLEETLRIQEQLLKLKEDALKIANDRFHQGQLPLQEVTKSDVDLNLQKNKLRTAKLNTLENKSQISSLFIKDIQTIEWPFAENTNPKLPAQPQIPLIEQKYWFSQSRENLWQSSKGEHWPSLDFQIQYQESPINSRTDKQFVGLLTLSLPIWNQYDTSAKVSAAYAQYVSALNDYKETEQTLKEKSIFQKEKIETARLNLSEAKKNLEISKKLYQDVLRGFRLGRISTNDLLLEQNRLLDSEDALTQSQLNFHQSLIETCALAGLMSSECLQ